MPKDKTASHIKILAAAREEFAEYGYENASMRRLGTRCGLTAAALYRHCRDKADLFREIVAPPAEKLEAWITERVNRGMEVSDAENLEYWKTFNTDMMRDLIYSDIEDYRLLITKAKGSPYENYLQDLAGKYQEYIYKLLLKQHEQGIYQNKINTKDLNMLLRAHIMAVFEPVIHGSSEEEACMWLKTLEEFSIPGWKKLLGY